MRFGGITPELREDGAGITPREEKKSRNRKDQEGRGEGA